MKTRLYFILGFLFTAFMVNPAFSQEKDALREARKLRSEAAYLEMKGETEQAIQCFEKSLQYLPDEKIEAKVVALKQKLTDAQGEEETSAETVPTTPSVIVPEPQRSNDNTEMIPEPSQLEIVNQPIAESAGETAFPITLPENDAKISALIDNYSLREDCLPGKDLAVLNSYFLEQIASAKDFLGAQKVLEDLYYSLCHPVWNDAEAMLLLYQTFFQKTPRSELMEGTLDQITTTAVSAYNWREAIEREKERLAIYRMGANEYRERGTLLKLLRYHLSSGDFDGVRFLIGEIQNLDPEGRYEQTYSANFVERHLTELEASPQHSIEWNESIPNPVNPREQYRKLVKWFVYREESDEIWQLEENAFNKLQLYGNEIARKLVSSCTSGYNHSRALLYLCDQPEDSVTPKQRQDYLESFLTLYWFDEEAEGVRRDLIEHYTDQGEFEAAAKTREMLVWEDIEDIDTNVEEYYRAIEIAQAWEKAEHWQTAKNWYEDALKLDQYGEWSKTKEVEAALATMDQKLHAEPELELPALTLEEQEILAKEILSRLSGLDEDQVREFEQGYLEIIYRCPDVPQVHEAYFRIGNLYRLAWDQPKNKKLIPLYEAFLQKYPDSEGIPHVANILTICLGEVENWQRLIEVEATHFLRELSSEPSDQDIARYSLHADHLQKAGKPDEALRWYKRVLVSDPQNHTFSARIALEAMAELGYDNPEAMQAIPAANAYE